MKLLTNSLVAALIICASGIVWAADNSKLVTMTLLPQSENTVADGPREADKLLWIQKTPAKLINLEFDLSQLPDGLIENDFKRCTLRLVAQKILFQPDNNEQNTGGTRIRIKGREAGNNKDYIVALSTLSAQNNPVTLNQQTSEEFKQAIYKAYSNKDKKIVLSLETDSDRAGGLFYSSIQSGGSPSNIPRLAITYQQAPPTLPDTLIWSQHQHDPEHTGRSAWTPFKNPQSFSLSEVALSGGAIASYPLVYRGDRYLVTKTEKDNFLVAIDFKGDELWRTSIGTGTVQRSPVISTKGIIYVVTENKISAYDLHQRGKAFVSTALQGKLSNYTDLTIGHDGSLFLALTQQNVNYIYGFTHDLKPYLRVGPFSSKGNDNISSVSVSADGQTLFAQIPEGGVTIDITDPSLQQTIELKTQNSIKPGEFYHTPIAGPEGDVMIFSDLSKNANKGNVWGTTTSKRLWNRNGTAIPQPVLGQNDLVYFIQDSGLQRHKYNTIGKGEEPQGKDLNSTSNLVLDSASNVYFWDNGTLRWHTNAGEILQQSFDGRGPEMHLRLTLAPDGSLWTNNNNGDRLFVFIPGYTEPDQTVKGSDIKDRNFYRATNTLFVEGVNIDKSTQVVFQAGESIRFARGFKVEKGGSLLCRTGI